MKLEHRKENIYESGYIGIIDLCDEYIKVIKMSKAEERSKEIMQAALDYANNLDDVKPTDDFSRNLCISLGQAFMKGAEWADEHQAEKDLELSWEDIKKICDISFEEACRLQRNMKGYLIYNKQHYQIVLKRFKKLKK